MRFTDKKALVTVIIGFSVLVLLGCWQMRRLEWKTDLIAKMEERLQREPVTMPHEINNIGNWQYRRVNLYGTFLHKKEFLVGPRTLDGTPGYYLVTPFEHQDGKGAVMVNRGFVDDAHLTSLDRPQGVQNVTGTMMMADRGTYPANDFDKRQWYWIEPAAMGQAAGLDVVSPLVVVAAPQGNAAWPKALPAKPEIRNEHKQYAIFWFTMAFILLAIYITWQRAQNKGKRHAGV
jgi:surfeit locus 1 family protein